MSLMERKNFIDDLEDIISDAKEDNKLTKLQGYYLLGRISFAFEIDIITREDYRNYLKKLEKIFGFTVDDYDAVVG